jgi:proteasome lid subunit RPN8/RPN11
MKPYRPIDVVITNIDAITAFKRRALKAKTHEVLGVLVGRVKGKIYVDDIIYPTQVAYTVEESGNIKQHDETMCIEYDPAEFKKIKGAIGTIHSHPDREPGISKSDMDAQSQDGDIVYAIYSFWKKKDAQRHSTSLDFYCGTPEVLVSTST